MPFIYLNSNILNSFMMIFAVNQLCLIKKVESICSTTILGGSYIGHLTIVCRALFPNFLTLSNHRTLCYVTRIRFFLVISRILESLAGCRTMLLFAVFYNIGALERNAYWFQVELNFIVIFGQSFKFDVKA